MKKPTKEQLNNFWKNANEYQLRDIIKYAKDKKIRDKADKLYDWKNAGEYQLRDIIKFAKDKEARDKAEKYLPEEKVNVFDYLINKE